MDVASTSVKPRRAIFLDRDGVINVKLPDNCYVTCPAEFRLLPGVLDALSVMKQLGFLLVITTNQRGIGRGFMTDEDLSRVHLHMEGLLRERGVALDGVYHCPHDESDQCDCRKPRPGMIFAACRDLKCDPVNSYMVGDSESDVAAGRAAGAMTVLLGAAEDGDADLTFRDLPDFARFLKEQSGSDERSQ